MIANVHRGPCPNASRTEKRRGFVWARNEKTPPVGNLQNVQLVFRRHVVRIGEGRTFSLVRRLGRSSSRQFRDTRPRGRHGGRLILGDGAIITGRSL